MEDSAKTYFASLVCNHPDGNHKRSVCALRNSIYIILDPHGLCDLCGLCVKKIKGGLYT